MTVTARHKSLRQKALRDLSLVPIAFVIAFMASAHFNISEIFSRWATGLEEKFNVDEFPIALLAAMATLLWFSARRWMETRRLLKQNNELLHHAMESQEEERHWIAQDLHDDLGQYLNAIKADATSVIKTDHLPNEVKKIALRIINYSDHAYHSARQIMHRLRPVALDDLGLSAALHHLVDTWRHTSADDRKTINYLLEISGDIDSLNENISINTYRVVQEGLTNIARHANSSSVIIGIHRFAETLEIRLTDNGCGMNPTAPYRGLGLAGMRERIEGLNGGFTLESALGMGTSIVAWIPIGKEQEVL